MFGVSELIYRASGVCNILACFAGTTHGGGDRGGAGTQCESWRSFWGSSSREASTCTEIQGEETNTAVLQDHSVRSSQAECRAPTSHKGQQQRFLFTHFCTASSSSSRRNKENPKTIIVVIIVIIRTVLLCLPTLAPSSILQRISNSSKDTSTILERVNQQFLKKICYLVKL
jgi:hypothetical protein